MTNQQFEDEMAFFARRAVVVTAVAACLAQPAVAEDLTPRDAAFRIMGASLNVPGSAAYCRSKGWLQDADLEPAVAWNKKHEAAMQKVIKVIEATGGVSKADRQALDRLAFKVIREQIEDGDPMENCRNFVDALRSGGLDLEAVPQFREALAALDRVK
ncbi:MAG: hypothetical protein DI537_10150 [Stutzerimonas stutzeri]|nr:MAG: hypothetical protein DI537_10150 [Stutzerimonas stutzeri]